MVARADKKKKLNSMTDEVKELHPMLAQLFPRLPQIQRVQYTHGVGEFGADFVLEKFDPTLDQTRHVGVVAKIGKIVQNTTEVENQIRECTLPRIIFNGERETRLAEVIVVTTGTITAGAQKKILDQFQARSITFIDGNQLLDLIDKHASFLWSDLPSEISAYLHRTQMDVRAADAKASLVEGSNLCHLFIDLDLIDKARGYDFKNPPKPIAASQLLDELKAPLTVVEGEMGAGKSKLLRQTALTSSDAQRFSSSKSLLPILTSFEDFRRDHDGKLASLIANVGDDLQSQSFLILIDGLDEVVADRGEASDAIRELVEQLQDFPSCRAIVTSRPLGEFDEFSAKEVARYSIQSLSLGKLKTFIQAFCTNASLSSRLIEDLKKSDLFRELPQRPISAILLTNLLLSEQSRELPSSMTELYAQSFELMLGRWDQKKGLATQAEYEAADQVCTRLARHVIDDRRAGVSIPHAQAEFMSYLQERNLNIDADALFNKTLSRSGVLSTSIDGAAVLFRHRSFAEFLYAKSLFRSGEPVPIDHHFDLARRTISYFYIGLKKDCEDLLRDVVSYDPKDEAERWMKAMNVPAYLMAGFATPYRVVKSSLGNLMVEFAQLYLDTRDGRSGEGFEKLPEAYLLWAFQRFVRDAYSYNWFGAALDNAAQDVWSSSSSDETRAYAMMFLGVVGLDLGNVTPLEILKDEMKVEALPIQVQIALKIELADEEGLPKSQGALKIIRAFERKVDRTFKHPATRQQLERFVRLPLGKTRHRRLKKN